jgi:putative transferase (TIGR04331 family)
VSSSGQKVALSPYSERNGATILIGASCADVSVGKVPNDLIQTTISPYRSHADIAGASEYCWEAALGLCERLTGRLNDILDVKRSPAYWEVLLLPWLVAWVENLYDRYLRLKWVRENIPSSILELPRVSEPSPLYYQSFDVWGKSHLHSINMCLYRLLIQRMGLSDRTRFLDVRLNETEEKSGVSTRSRLNQLIRRLVPERALHKVLSKTHPNPFTLAEIGVVEIRNDSVQDSNFPVQPLDRSSLIVDQSQDEFKRILGALTANALPISLFEEHRARSDYAAGVIRDRKISALCISNNFWGSDTIKFVAAELRQSGSSVIGRQHGAGYGCYELVVPEKVERRITDFFITWGWTDGTSRATVPLPDPRLSRLLDSHRPANEDILFMGSHGPMYMFRYQSYWIPEFVQENYCPMQGVFLNALAGAVKARIVYRPYPTEYGWGEKDRLRNFVSRVRFDKTPNGTDSMARCSLAVFDHPGTSLLESLTMNTPTVAFWDHAQCPMRIEAQPYFRLLQDAGILFQSPSEAAKQINFVADDPQRWWKSSAVQLARKSFCRHFAWADPDWQNCWNHALVGRV